MTSNLKTRAAARRRRGKVKAATYPSAVERQHVALLRGLHAEVMTEVRAAAERAMRGVRRDAFEDDYDQARLRAAAATSLNRRLKKIRTSAERLEQANKRALVDSMGIPLVFKDDALGSMMDTWVSRHVQLISRMEDEVISDIGVMVREGVDSGLSWSALKKDVGERATVGSVRAELIARTEISSANAELTKTRFEELGVQRVRWRTAKDDRVRAAHKDMEGVEFELSNPPHVGGGTDVDGKKIPDEGYHLPGQWFQCRCRMEPVVDWMEEPGQPAGVFMPAEARIAPIPVVPTVPRSVWGPEMSLPSAAIPSAAIPSAALPSAALPSAALPSAAVALDLRSFATRVKEAAKVAAKHGPDRAYIYSVWQSGTFGMTLEAFKERLLAARVEGLVRLTRADLRRAMDPYLLKMGNIPYLSTEFDFIAVE